MSSFANSSVSGGWGGVANRSRVPALLTANNENGTNTSVNEAAQELYVRFREFMIGMDWYKLFGFCVKHLPHFNASQVIFSLSVEGKLFKVVSKDQDGNPLQSKMLLWRKDLLDSKLLLETRALERCEYEHQMQEEEAAREPEITFGVQNINPNEWEMMHAPGQEESEMEECLDIIESEEDRRLDDIEKQSDSDSDPSGQASTDM